VVLTHWAYEAHPIPLLFFRTAIAR